MNDFIYMYDLFTMSMMRMGEKPRNIYKNKGKIPRLVAPVYKIGGRLFSGAKEPETSRTYPKKKCDKSKFSRLAL